MWWHYAVLGAVQALLEWMRDRSKVWADECDTIECRMDMTVYHVYPNLLEWVWVMCIMNSLVRWEGFEEWFQNIVAASVSSELVRQALIEYTRT